MSAAVRTQGARGRRWAAVVVVVAVLVAACTGDDDAAEVEGSTTIPPASTLFRIGAESWPSCLNPITCDSPELREQILQHVLPVMFEIDAAGEYRRSPLLAADPGVEAGAQGMTITYQLNPAARWDDDTPVTSSDVHATWRAVMTTPGADTRGYDLVTEVDDEDPTVAVVTLSSPYGDWKELFGGGRGWVLQADAFGPSTDLTGRFEDELPFSAAPYRLAAWNEDAAVLARADGYWAESRVPSIDQVRLARVSIDELVEPSAFHLLIPTALDPGAGPDGFATRSLPGTGVLGVWFDRRTPLLEPRSHRLALSALIDREEIIAQVPARVAWRMPGQDAAPIDCLGWIPDVGPWCDAAVAELLEPDPAVASYVLALDGWATNEAGDLVRDDVPFAVPVSHDPAVPGAEIVADAVVEALESIGITTVRHEVSTARWAATRAADPQTGVGIFGFELGLSPMVDDLYGCPEGPPSSVLSWCAPEVVTPARELTAAVAQREQLDLVARIGAVAAEDVAWIPVFRQTRTSFLQADVVRIPADAPAVGGPLAGLYAFTMAE